MTESQIKIVEKAVDYAHHSTAIIIYNGNRIIWMSDAAKKKLHSPTPPKIGTSKKFPFFTVVLLD